MKIIIALFSLSLSFYSTKSLSNSQATLLDQAVYNAILVADNSGAQNLENNDCLKKLKDTDEVFVSAAFHDGAGGFGQLVELISRKPWGVAVRASMQMEIEKLIKQQSPFLMVTMTKKQALQLESHRDLIKWILVQSTETSCG